MMLRLAIVGPGVFAFCTACGLQTAGELAGDGAPEGTIEGTDGDVRFDADDGRADRDETGPPDDADLPEDGEEGGPLCGDGVVEAPEECDQGEFNDDLVPDACRTNCRRAWCGDSVTDTGEECDYGAGNSDTTPDACRTDCRPARCGDGVRDTGEACDDGNSVPDDGCTNACAPPTCGDRMVQPPEECDDGNDVDTDGCLNTCVTARCGDRVVWSGVEQCDGDPPQSCGTSCGSIGERRCVDCAWAPDCVPPAERCNGQDDDCVGGCDNGFACCLGATATQACGFCGTQSRTCGAGCAWDAWGACTGTGVCAAGTTETRTCPCVGTETRTCSASCTWGPWSGCGAAVCTPDATRSCTTTCGSTGTQTCSASCTWGACVPPAETCNGRDDDCVGGCDQLWECCMGGSQSRSCGFCGTGTETRTCGATCTWGAWGACVGGGACSPLSTQPCTNTCGVAGAQTCSATCAWGPCCAPAEVCGNTCDDNCNGATNEGCVPPNDLCSGAIDIGTGGDFTGSTALAGNDNTACACSGDGARDVWYRFTLAQSEVVFLTLQGDGETWDSVLHVRSGSCTGADAACNDDSCSGSTPWRSQWTGILAAGTYYVIVDGCGSTSAGPFRLRFARSPCPEATAARQITAPGTFNGNSCGAANDTSGTCTGTTSPDVPYFLGLCPGSYALRARTCGDGYTWDSGVYIRQDGGGTCGGREVACNDDNCSGAQWLRSDTSAAVTGPALVFIVLDGPRSSNRCGDYGLNVSY